MISRGCFKSFVVGLFPAVLLMMASGCTTEKSLTNVKGDFSSEVTTAAKPWTNLNFPENSFHFAVLPDRCGGCRPGAFEQALRALNRLEPDLVMCVGDLIEGYCDARKGEEPLCQQWDDVDRLLQGLRMPFFYTCGNHDLSTPEMQSFYQKRRGQTYYSFMYRGVLFMILRATPEGVSLEKKELGAEQLAWVKQTLSRHADARWTFFFMHAPMWNGQPGEKKELAEIEDTMGDRPFTMLAGHTHVYAHAINGKRHYFTLGVAGGAGGLPLISYSRSQDHILWVTMTEEGPKFANVMTNFVLSEDLEGNPQQQFEESLALTRMVPAPDGQSWRFQLEFSNPFSVPLSARYEQKMRDGENWCLTPVAGELVVPPHSRGVFPLEVAKEVENYPVPMVELSFTAGDELSVLNDSRRFFRLWAPHIQAYFPVIAAKMAPAVDGNLDDEVWSGAPQVSGLWPSAADHQPAVATEVWLAYDRSNLYVAWRCAEPELSNLVAKVNQADGPLWGDDSVELFIDAGQDQQTYRHFICNPLGMLYDAVAMNPTFASQARVAAGREKDAWTVEMAIPWEALGILPEPGKRMGVEFCRMRRAVKLPELYQQPPLNGGNHQPVLFGELELQ